MKILVVTQYFWPENFRINDLVGELAGRGHEVTVLTGLPNYPEGSLHDGYRASPHDFSEYRGARIVRVPIVLRGRGGWRLALNYASFALSGSVLGAMKIRGERFDCIFVCQLSPVTIAIPALVIKRLTGTPVVMWILDLWPDSLRSVGVVKSSWLLGVAKALVRKIYAGCDLILAQSRAFMPRIESDTDGHARVEYFPSWSEELFLSDLGKKAPEIPEKPGSFNIMFAGNIGDAQDFPAILAAAEKLRDRPDVRWLIVGDGRAAAWVRSEIARRGLETQVLMLGRHPIARMPEFFAHADALLVSLKADPAMAMTIPGKVQSYLASGLPILAMLDGEGGDVVERWGAGLRCASGDADALARAVVQLAEMSAAERGAIGARGLAATREEFDREKLITMLEKWLAETAATRKAGKVRAP